MIVQVTPEERAALYGRLPRVTDILAATMVDARWFTVQARELGQALHACVQLWLEGALEEESVDARLRENLDAFIRFWKSERPELVACELTVWDDRLGYVGTLDLLVRWRGDLVVIDLKRGAWAAWHPVQLEAYALAVSKMVGQPVRIANLYPRTHAAVLQEHVGAERLRARHDWLAALRLYHRRRDRERNDRA